MKKSITNKISPDDFFNEVLGLNHIQFARAFLKIQTQSKKTQPYRPNKNQLGLLKIIDDCSKSRRPCRVINLKARHYGASTATEALMFERYYRNPGFNAEIVANVSMAANNMKRMFERYHSNLPEIMRPKIIRKNERVFAYDGWDSQVRFSSAESRDNIGVSDNILMAHLTEFALYPEAMLTWSKLKPAISESSESIVIIESTARGHNYFHSMWEAAEAGEIEFIPYFVAWFDIPRYSRTATESKVVLTGLDEEERVLRNAYGVTDDQLRWRRITIAELGSIDQFHEDYPSNPKEAFVGSGLCFFDTNLCNKMISKNKIDENKPKAVGVLADNKFVPTGRGYMDLWKEPEKGCEYIIGADCAGMEVIDNVTGKTDYSHAAVYKLSPFEQVACIHHKHIEKIYAEELMQLGRYYNNATICVERNGLGRAIVNFLMEDYDNLFCEESRGRWKRTYSGYPGWETKTNNRLTLISDLKRVMRESPEAFKDMELFRECLSFVQKPNGRWEHEQGKHDDRIFAHGQIVQMLISLPGGVSRSSMDRAANEDEFDLNDVRKMLRSKPQTILFGADNKPILSGIMSGFQHSDEARTSLNEVA